MISYIRIIVVFGLLLGFAGCKVQKGNISTEELTDDTRPSILFLNLSLAYDSIANEYDMKLINQIVAKGRVKGLAIEDTNLDTNNLVYSLLNNKGKVITKHSMQNPLNKHIEYVDNNGTLKMRSVQLNQIDFSIRVDLPPATRSVVFEMANKRLLLIDLRK
ncbi:hypothetical protein EMN47_12815 [Prolixibacteraceae bacterium JC049]|nr:hypothetical protein [Prolixibacteraceae bacterium JC049]